MIPVVLSAVALALLVVLFQAGTKVGTGQDYYLLQVSTMGSLYLGHETEPPVHPGKLT